MNHLKRLVAIILIVAVTAITAGCSAGIRDAAEHSTTNAVSAAESTESIQPTETDNTAAKASYTMADIKNLKNTEHFAKNTLEHIFDGTINGKGKATGYHYTQVTDSKGKVIDGTRSDVDDNGVFTGKVEVSGIKKNGFSSFFPESWTPQQVVDAINTAYDDATKNPSNPKGSLWIGYCGDLEIDMYLDSSKRITTAFPVYEGD